MIKPIHRITYELDVTMRKGGIGHLARYSMRSYKGAREKAKELKKSPHYESHEIKRIESQPTLANAN